MKHLVVVLGLAICGNALAIQPQAGFWAIDGELNGQPGRGFQIDTSGDVLVFSYYGYRPDGLPTFYLSSGPFSGSGFSAPLMEYQGGTALGGAFQSGQPLSNKGVVNISFTSTTKGVMTLPGEPERAISRFTYSNNADRLNAKTYEGNTRGVGPFTVDSTKFIFNLDSAKKFTLVREAFFSGACKFEGTYELAGVGVEAQGTYRCADFSEGSFKTGNLAVSDEGFYTGTLTQTSNGGREITEFHIGQ